MLYRKEIDGLRAVAVIPVILFHAGYDLFSGGFLGVDVFFVISGFLITSIIMSDLEGNKFSIIQFYERRARRIIPALSLVILVTLGLALLWMLPGSLISTSEAIIAATLFLSNVYFWRNVGYFEFGSELNPVLHTWSLSVEEQYYVFFPVFMAVFWFLGRRKLSLCILAIAVVSLAFSEWARTEYTWANFYLLPTRAWELFVGALAAFYISRIDALSISFKIKNVISVVGLIAVTASMIFFNGQSPTPGVVSLIPTVGTALIILFAREGTLACKILSNQFFVFIGLISYSLYLWHQPIFAFAKIRSVEDVLPNIYYPFLILLSVLLAYITWKYVETPFRSKKQFSRKAIFTFSASVMLLMVAIPSWIIASSGLPARIPEKVNVLNQHLLDIAEKRNTFISADGCYDWAQRDMPKFDRFLANWACHGEPAVLKSYPIFITGDSMAASIAMAMSLNNADVGHITSGGCSLVPSLMTPQCEKQFNLAVDFVRKNTSYKQLWLVSRFKDESLSLKSISNMIQFFSRAGVELVFFTAPPQFFGLDQILVKQAWFNPSTFDDFSPDANTHFAELSERKELLELLSRQGVKHVNVRELFCSLSPSCSYKSEDGTFLVVDKDHLSVDGAKLFGGELLQRLP